MRRIYLDACVIIYMIEGAPPFQSRARARVTELCLEPSTVILTSLLSRIECRTKPIRESDERLLLYRKRSRSAEFSTRTERREQGAKVQEYFFVFQT
jgi:predicted nucleic acid-binding protein